MKVIIADDEKWVRAAVIKTIPFEKLGLSLLGEASNGLEALELCSKLKPDILITDIKMPGLTGLELIGKLREFLPEIRIIIISGYSDFEYAKTAMNLGVTNYILKPVDEKEISQVLLKIKESILNQRKQKEENNLIKKQYEKTLTVLQDKFLNQLISPNCLTLETIRNKLGKFNLNFFDTHFTVVVFCPGKPVSGDENKLKQYRIIIERVMKRYLKAVTFTNSSRDYELISVANHSQNINNTSLQKAFGLCTAIYNKHFGSSVSIGVSMPVSQLTRLPDAYVQSCESLLLGFWNNSGRIFYYRPNVFSDTINIHLTEEMLDDISVNIKTYECNKAAEYIDSLCSHLKAQKLVKPELVKDFFWTLIQSVTTRLNVQLSFIEYELSFSGIHPYEIIKNTASLDELAGSVKGLIEQICTHYTQKHPVTDENIIESAKKFIEDNFDKNISLEQVSRYVHLNPTYFSELFKKSTGMSFIDYKTYLRIENAKKLLSTTSQNIDRISSSLGYTDPKYFSKLFKRITGKTPQDYKKGGGSF